SQRYVDPRRSVRSEHRRGGARGGRVSLPTRISVVIAAVNVNAGNPLAAEHLEVPAVVLEGQAEVEPVTPQVVDGILLELAGGGGVPPTPVGRDGRESCSAHFSCGGHSSWGACRARFFISSTTLGSARVVVSPRSRPSATSFSRRRMILPLRVLGRSSVKMIV